MLSCFTAAPRDPCPSAYNSRAKNVPPPLPKGKKAAAPVCRKRRPCSSPAQEASLPSSCPQRKKDPAPTKVDAGSFGFGLTRGAILVHAALRKYGRIRYKK